MHFKSMINQGEGFETNKQIVDCLHVHPNRRGKKPCSGRNSKSDCMCMLGRVTIYCLVFFSINYKFTLIKGQDVFRMN